MSLSLRAFRRPVTTVAAALALLLSGGSACARSAPDVRVLVSLDVPETVTIAAVVVVRLPEGSS